MNNGTPRERVRMALNHQEPERVPIDVGGTHDSTFLEESFTHIQKLLKTRGAGRVANRWLGSVYPDEETYLKLGVDFRPVALPAPEYELAQQSDGSVAFTDEWGLKWTKKPESYYFDVLQFFHVNSISDVESLPWPKVDTRSPGWINNIARLRDEAERLHSTEYALILDFGVAPMTMTQLFLGFEESSIALISNPKILEALMDKVLEIYMSQAQDIFNAVGHLVEAVYAFADDLGTQKSPWLAPEQYKRLVKPYHKRIVDFIRKQTSAKIIFHSCGAIFDFIPELIDVGIDALNPVQVSAEGMNPERLKKEFGKDLVFWGAIDTQHTLPHGSQDDVRKEVRERIDALAKGGGYVLAPVHNIQPDVPAENIIAMVDEAKRYSIS